MLDQRGRCPDCYVDALAERWTPWLRGGFSGLEVDAMAER